MVSGMRDAWRVLAATVALFSAGGAAAEEGPVLLAEEATGSVEVAGERSVLIEGLHGEISIVAGQPGRLAFANELGGAQAAPLPVALWLEGDAFRIAPPSGARDVPSVFAVWVPPSMRVVVRTNDSTVYVKETKGSVDLKGQRNRLEVFGATGAVSAELDGGSFSAVGGSGDLDVRGRNLSVRLEGVGGSISLRVSKGASALSGVRGDLDGEFEDVDVTVDQAFGPCRVGLRGGRAKLKGMRQGADVFSAGAPLTVESSKGTITVESDAGVQFRDVEGAIRVMAYGGAVRAVTVKGSVDVKGVGADEVGIESVSGTVTIEGQGLRTKVSDIGGDVTVRTSSGPIEAENVSGALTVEADSGRVELRQLPGAVRIRSRASDVSLAEASGPVTIDADGGQVDILWSAVGLTADSSIKNDGGGVSVRFPAAGGCRVEAEAKYGRVEVDGLPGITVSDGGARATGLVGRISRPLLRIVANGDIVLSGKGEGEAEPR